MTPRPHVGFVLASRLPKSSLLGGFRRSPAVGAMRTASDPVKGAGPGDGDRGWRPRPGRQSLRWIIALEAGAFLAMLLVLLRASADPRPSAWLLLGLSAAVLVLSWLRRQAQAA